jgi:DNA recombination protein RmuC
MNGLFLVTFLLVGLIIGVVLGIFWSRAKASGAIVDQTRLQSELDQARGKIDALTTSLAESQARGATNEKLQNDMQAINKLVEDLKKEAAEADRRRIDAESSLRQQLSNVNENSQNLAAQTLAIAGALTNSQARGRFGEAQLERLLESAGLVEGVHYVLQQNVSSDDQLLGRPDVTIYMPGEREIYIDAKFPFQRFYEAFESEDEAEREELLKEHTKDLLKHCEDLAKRKYTSSGVSPDFVLVFAPIDSILSQALKSDPQFLDKTFRSGITVATPTSLFAILRTIGDVLSRHKVAQGAAEIQSIATKFVADLSNLYDKIRVVGERITSTVTAYNEMIPTAQTTVLRSIKQMQGMQIPGGPKKDLKEIESAPRTLKSKLANEKGAVELDEVIDLEEGDE